MREKRRVCRHWPRLREKLLRDKVYSSRNPRQSRQSRRQILDRPVRREAARGGGHDRHITALRKFVRSGMTHKPTRGATPVRLRLRLGSVAPPPIPTPLGVTAAAKSDVGHEHRAVCWSPRGEASPSDFCCGRDGDHADREFDFADLVLSGCHRKKKATKLWWP